MSVTAPVATTPATGRATGRLALLLQEALTAIVRLRADRQAIADSASFRSRMQELLTTAEREARAAGYDETDARLATFAVVALLDESALNSRQPALADWSRRPMQDELYGSHMAGEWFYQHLEQLLARPDTEHLGDVLEVHHLALLLGFRGKYGAHDPGQLDAVTQRVGERLARIRGAAGDLAPAWRPPADGRVRTDRWMRPLVITFVVMLVAVGAVWGAAAYTLGAQRAAIARMADAGAREPSQPRARSAVTPIAPPAPEAAR